VITLAPGMSAIDLQFLGRPAAILTGVIHHAGSVALIDPGPASCLGALEAGLTRLGYRLTDVTHVLLTHVHLDHAGATGTIARRQPHLRVVVHRRGARHVAEPGRLIQSAARLYGSAMEQLWGEILPVPESQIDSVEGGERLEVGGRAFQVAYTPGHASHHVSYFESSARVAYVGDVAGVSIDGGYVLPPTPPPDIDVELWRESVRTIEAWSPDTLFLTHGGAVTTVGAHLGALLDNLEVTAGMVRASLDRDESDEARLRWFVSELRAQIRRELTDAATAAYEAAAPFDLLWLGLARYWRTRAPAGA
jgi:glyoxylase-like metal-dependent hydrolase (beta-lactamase superfamily II)